MQKLKLLLLGSVTGCAAVVLAQTLPPDLPSKGNRGYTTASSPHPQNARQTSYVGGQAYVCILEEPALLSDWESATPLPLGLSKVEEITRTELRKLVKDEPSWLVTDFRVSRFGRGGSWYYAITLRPAVELVGERPESYTLLVDFSGNPGKFGLLTRTSSSTQTLAVPKPTDARRAEHSDEDILPAGAIQLSNVDLHQVLRVYQELSGRTVDIAEPVQRMAALISLTNSEAMSRAQVLRLFEKALRDQAHIVATHTGTNKIVLSLELSR